ncbi:MAG: hypothetical protein GKR87_16240 [Kiritimatiellae bacterium]|nr:hypothetical protein [Kiritimatiellia bacterium]
MGNKTQRADIRIGGSQRTDDYQYDSIYRLTQSATNPLAPINYSFDGVGNRTSVSGSSNPGSYTMDVTNALINQYSSTPFDQRQYDANGSLTALDQSTLTYDYRNQMVEYIDAGSTQRHTYAYDPFGRRIAKGIDVDGVANEIRYFYNDDQVIEEQDAVGATLASYVYGLYIDEALNMQRSGTNYYYHTDDLYNVMAITDTNGSVVERYDYDDYGQPIFFNQSAISGGL